MNHYDLNLMKRRAAANAWTKEKDLICQGKGTRDWAPVYQEAIMELNRIAGYVAHFVEPINGNDECKIQFLDFPMEFLSAHRKDNPAPGHGFFNYEEMTVSSKIPDNITVTLAEPSCIGYKENRRELFAGQKNKFGIEVRAKNAKNRAFAASRFGLPRGGTTSQTVPPTAAERKQKYGY